MTGTPGSWIDGRMEGPLPLETQERGVGGVPPGLDPGTAFILGAPVTVTAIALLETGRLKRRYGIRLGAHPASHPSLPGRPTPPVPPTGLPYVPPQGNPYGHPSMAGGNPYAPGAGGNPYAPGPQHPYAPGAAGNPYAPRPRNPYGG
jgi:hypothetical protein